jgi:hypothetical protein
MGGGVAIETTDALDATDVHLVHFFGASTRSKIMQ